MSSSDREIPSDEEYIDQALGDGGYLSALPGFKTRAAQIELTRKIDLSLSFGSHAFIEGGTGLGKSFSYLIPATYYAATKGKRVVVATANLALQEQLVKKDLPTLKRVLPWPVDFAVLKGVNNYLCISEYERSEKQGQIDRIDPAMRLPLLNWKRSLPEFHLGKADAEGTSWPIVSGDRNDLPFVPPHDIWSLMGVTSDGCAGSKCTDAKRCFARAAKARAMEAGVVVVNYALLFMALQLPFMTFPKFDFLILDEAHEAENIARNSYGDQLSLGSFKRVARRIEKYGGELTCNRLLQAAAKVFEAAYFFAIDKNLYNTVLTQPPEAHPRFTYIWRELKAEANILLGEMASWDPDHFLFSPGTPAIKTKVRDELQRLVERIDLFMTMRDPDQAYFFEVDQRNRLAFFVRKPVSVAGLLRRHMWDVSPCVAMSATLSIEGSFEYVSKALGCEPGFVDHIAESPFNWDKQALFFVPQNIPNVKDDDYQKAVLWWLHRMIKLSHGRLLGLFTSHRMKKLAADSLGGSDYTILLQGDEPVPQLIKKFKEDEHSVLLGTASLWTGVDVPGQALTSVFIDKLPFPNPSDPLVYAMNRRFEANGKTSMDCFMERSVPETIMTLKQGFGRLIRSVSDHGVVCCTDNRLVTKNYGRRFIRSLPPVRLTRSESDVQAFLLDRMDPSEWAENWRPGQAGQQENDYPRGGIF